MKNRSIHENLDTSFVNLSALVKYLRRRQFTGSVKVQLNGYKADITLQENNQLKVSEHDQLSGRISEGEEALQRILIRAREPGGTINVFQQIEDSAEIAAKPTAENLNVKTQSPIVHTSPELAVEAENIQPIPKPIESPQQTGKEVDIKRFRQSKSVVKNNSDLPEKSKKANVKTNGNDLSSGKKSTAIKQSVSLPDFPFRLSNKVEERAKKVQAVSNEDWQTLLNLTVELLGVIDNSLAQAKLDFTSAFRKVCAEIADDYPFLNPSSEIFTYSKGKIKMTEQINPKIFVTSIIQAIHKILDKLESTPKFAEVHRATVQTILAIMNKRENLYDKFDIAPQLKRTLGV